MAASQRYYLPIPSDAALLADGQAVRADCRAASEGIAAVRLSDVRNLHGASISE